DLERDDFSSNCHLALIYCWSMIPRVEPEGMLFRKPVSTFRDHALASRHSLHCYVDFGEMCEAVCLRPYADLARIDERLVAHLDEVRAVEPHLELFTVTFQAKRMPDVFQYRQILPGHLPADTADHLVKADVVLKCISACDVIVIGVLQS